MTYQEIVNRIQDVVNDHYMLADFGYGDLSDLKTRFENTSGDSAVQADYPYLFLNPATHTRTGAAVTYNFNMIVMDMARGEVSDNPYNNILAIQSQCQQYIDDVIAQLWNGYTDQPQVLWDGLSYNTFNERFQDDVAGMTVNLQIMVPQAINNCITPINKYRNLITRRNTAEWIYDYSTDPVPDDQTDRIMMYEWSYDGQTSWVRGKDPQYGTNYASIKPTITGRYKLEFNLVTRWNEPEDGSGRLKYGVRVYQPGGLNVQKTSDIAWQSVDTVVNLNQIFELDLVAGEEYYFILANDYDVVPVADILGYQMVGSRLEISLLQ